MFFLFFFFVVVVLEFITAEVRGTIPRSYLWVCLLPPLLTL